MRKRMRYGEVLRAFIEHPGLYWSLRELARRVDISAGYLSNICTGTNPPPAPELRERIAEAIRQRQQEMSAVLAVEVDGVPYSLKDLVRMGAAERCYCLHCEEWGRGYCTSRGGYE